MSEDSIFITDDNGKEVEMKIYLTFEANDKKYVVVYSATNEDELYSFIYDDDGNLYQIETEEELQMVNEVIDAYEQEEK